MTILMVVVGVFVYGIPSIYILIRDWSDMSAGKIAVVGWGLLMMTVSLIYGVKTLKAWRYGRG